MHNRITETTVSGRILHVFSTLALASTALTAAGQGALAQQSPATTLDTITVQGSPPAQAPASTAPAEPAAEPAPAPETAYGPVDGYLATRSATGIKTDTPLNEIPQSISVVGQEQIRDQGAQTLQDTLRYSSGVVADGYGIDSRVDSIFVRGTIATEYLDGLRRTYGSYTNYFRVDPYFLERVEVLKGPSSVLYGQAAVGGIINSVSKRPRKEAYGEIGVEYGSFDFKQTRFDFTGPAPEDKRWSYRLTGLVRDADTQTDYVPDDRFAVQPALMFEPSADTSITLLGHFRRDRTGSTQQFLPHIGTIFPNVSGNFIPWDRFVGEPGDFYDTDAATGTLLFEHKFNDALKFQHNTRYSDISNEYYGYYPGFFAGLTTNPQMPYLNPQQTQIDRVLNASKAETEIFTSDTNLQGEFRTGAIEHKVLGGLDYSHYTTNELNGQALANSPLAGAPPFNVHNPVYGQGGLLLGTSDPCDLGSAPALVTSVPLCDQPEQTVEQTGLYFQDQMKLGNWIAVLGGRQDWAENGAAGSVAQKSDAFTYRTGLMYELPFGLTPYVNYSESFIPVVGTAFDGTTFDPREGVMYEAGFKYQPRGSAFAINGAAFEITESGRLSADPNNPNFSVQAGEVGIKGWEIEGSGNVTERLKLIASYAYTDAEYTGGDQKGFQVASVPEHLASFWAIHDFSMFGREGFSVGGGVRYVGSSWDGTDSLKTPSYTVFDAMLAYETEDWRLQVTATNLADKEYLTTCLNRGDCFLGTSRTVIAGVTRKF